MCLKNALLVAFLILLAVMLVACASSPPAPNPNVTPVSAPTAIARGRLPTSLFGLVSSLEVTHGFAHD